MARMIEELEDETGAVIKYKRHTNGRGLVAPTARVAEGRWLGEQPTVHALMDCSDGLATDLGHICRESRVRATIILERLPLSPAVREAARAFGRDPYDWATGGGEDYELLLTCEPAAASALASAAMALVKLRRMRSSASGCSLET